MKTCSTETMARIISVNQKIEIKSVVDEVQSVRKAVPDITVRGVERDVVHVVEKDDPDGETSEIIGEIVHVTTNEPSLKKVSHNAIKVVDTDQTILRVSYSGFQGPAGERGEKGEPGTLENFDLNDLTAIFQSRLQ